MFPYQGIARCPSTWQIRTWSRAIFGGHDSDLFGACDDRSRSAAGSVVEEVRRQFREKTASWGQERPDYARAVTPHPRGDQGMISRPVASARTGGCLFGGWRFRLEERPCSVARSFWASSQMVCCELETWAARRGQCQESSRMASSTGRRQTPQGGEATRPPHGRYGRPHYKDRRPGSQSAIKIPTRCDLLMAISALTGAVPPRSKTFSWR